MRNINFRAISNSFAALTLVRAPAQELYPQRSLHAIIPMLALLRLLISKTMSRAYFLPSTAIVPQQVLRPQCLFPLLLHLHLPTRKQHPKPSVLLLLTPRKNRHQQSPLAIHHRGPIPRQRQTLLQPTQFPSLPLPQHQHLPRQLPQPVHLHLLLAPEQSQSMLAFYLLLHLLLLMRPPPHPSRLTPIQLISQQPTSV